MPASKFLKGQVKDAEGELFTQRRKLGKAKKPRTALIIILLVAFLVWPGVVVSSLVLAHGHLGVPAVLGIWVGWLYRLFMVIIMILLIWLVVHRYHDRIAAQREKVDEAREELDRRREAVRKADAKP